MSLQYKAYLLRKHHGHHRGENVKEIRRFTVDTDVTSSYDYLKNKVSAVFPDIGNSFTLHYKDTEDDMISFSSDEELIQALSQIDDGIFRLYIKSKDEARKDKKDKCGKRWAQFPFGFGLGEYPHENQSPGLFGHPPPPHGHPPPPPHHGHPPPPSHGHPPPPPHGHPQHGAWAGFGMAPNAWGFGPWGHPEPQTQTQAQTGGEKQTSSSSEDDGTQQQQQSQGSASATATAYLNSVGEAVAGFLKPLGIDVDIDVEHNGQRSKCSESENKKKQREEEEKEKEQPAPEETAPKSTEVPTSAASAPPAETDWTVVQDQADADMNPVSPRPEVMNVDSPMIINPRLNDAMAQMLGMGFTNEGGWLTHLLEAHECDIARALDAMQPGGGSRA